MKKLKLLLCLFFIANLSLFGQDSTKLIRHEFGFNTVSLVKQLFSNNPTNTLEQLPYDIYYNFYFNPTIDMRVGLGFRNITTSTEIEGQSDPRKTTDQNFNLRLGIGNDFVRYKSLTLNAFADVLYKSATLASANTTTTQGFPNPVSIIKTTTSDVTRGVGIQAGLGAKYNLIKNLSIYIEVPLGFMYDRTASTVTYEESGQAASSSTNKSSRSNAHISLPTTLYLVLRF